MGNSICIESEPTYLLRLPNNNRSNSFGGYSQNSNGGGQSSSRSAYSEGGNNNNNNSYNNSGLNSARSSGAASSVPSSAFDGFDHNIKTIGFELRDGRLQYRFPDIAQNLASVQSWRKHAYDLSHLALIVLRVSRKPPGNKDFVVTTSDATSLYTFAALSEEVFTPAGLQEPRSIEIPLNMQWRAAAHAASTTSNNNGISPSSSPHHQNNQNGNFPAASSSSSCNNNVSAPPPTTMALYLYRGKRAHPRAVMEAMLILNQIERNFIHDPQGLHDLFFNRLSGAYPCSLQFINGSWDAPSGSDAASMRQSNHILRAFLGKLNNNNNNNGVSSTTSFNRVDSFSQQMLAVALNNNNSNNSGLVSAREMNNNNNGQHMRTSSGSNGNVNSSAPFTATVSNNNSNIQDNTMKLSDLKPLVLPATTTSNNYSNMNNKNNQVQPQVQRGGQDNKNNNSNYDEIIRSRTSNDLTKQVQNAMRNDTHNIEGDDNATSSSSVMANLTNAEKSSLVLPGVGGGELQLQQDAKDESDEDYPVDDREMRLRRAAPQAAEVLPGLFVGGEMPARNRSLLKSKEITHVINCAAGMLENQFPDEFEYTSLNLSDSADEPIQFLFPHVVEIIDRVLEIERGHVFVHCHQGVSRSCTFVIAYVMWKKGLPYNNAYKFVRERRDVCSPNAGFMCNLMRWEDMLANSPRFALIEYGPYRKDMQWPYIWRVRLPNHQNNNNSNMNNEESSSSNGVVVASAANDAEKLIRNGEDSNSNPDLAHQQVEIDSRTCTALVSFGERGTTAKLFKGVECSEALFGDAIERLQSWVLFGNFSSSSSTSTHYLLVEYLNSDDVEVIPHKHEESVFSYNNSNNNNNNATDSEGSKCYYNLTIKSTKMNAFSELLSPTETYEVSKQNFLKEQERLAKTRIQQQQQQQEQGTSSITSLRIPQQNQNQQNSTKINLAINNNNNTNNNLTVGGVKPLAPLKFGPIGGVAPINTNSQQQQQQQSLSASHNNNNNNNSVSSATGACTSPDASQDVRSSNALNSKFNNSSFIALRGPDWEPIGETELLDWEDFDPEEVYLFFIQPKSSRELGTIYMWVGEDSGWGQDSCIESYDNLIRDAKNFAVVPPPQQQQQQQGSTRNLEKNKQDGNGDEHNEEVHDDGEDFDEDKNSNNNEGDVHRGISMVHELLKHRAFENQRMIIIREREEPDDFVALF